MVNKFTYKAGVCFDPSGRVTLLRGGPYLLVKGPLVPIKYLVQQTDSFYVGLEIDSGLQNLVSAWLRFFSQMMLPRLL